MNTLSLQITSNSYNKLKPIVIIQKKDKSKLNNFNVSKRTKVINKANRPHSRTSYRVAVGQNQEVSAALLFYI